MNFPGRFFEGTLWLRGLEGFRGAPSCWEFHISSFYFHVVRFCTILCNFFWWCPRWSHLDSFHQLGFISPISSMYSTLLNYEPNSRAEPCSKAAKKPVKPIAAVVASCHSELGRARRCIGTTCVICVFRGFLSIFLQNRLELELVWLVWGFGSTITKVRQMHVWYGIWDIIEIRSAWKGCLLPLSGTWKHKLPGGWETALAVEHVLKKKVWQCGAVRVISHVSMISPGENRVMLKWFHGIYRVLWLWDDGRFLLLSKSLQSAKHLLSR